MDGQGRLHYPLAFSLPTTTPPGGNPFFLPPAVLRSLQRRPEGGLKLPALATPDGGTPSGPSGSRGSRSSGGPQNPRNPQGSPRNPAGAAGGTHRTRPVQPAKNPEEILTHRVLNQSQLLNPQRGSLGRARRGSARPRGHRKFNQPAAGNTPRRGGC
jgi:hypothetical protein